MTAKTNVNYTPEQTEQLVADYKAGATVESLAVAMGKSVRSVVAKLSREGCYKAKERTTKSGDPVVKKATLADSLALMAGLTEAEATSLEKVNKTALVKLMTAIAKANI